MKDTGRCPKCERAGRPGDQIVHAQKVDDMDHGVTTFTELALMHQGWLFPDRRGYLEAYVCNDCGYAEFYVKDIPLPIQKKE